MFVKSYKELFGFRLGSFFIVSVTNYSVYGQKYLSLFVEKRWATHQNYGRYYQCAHQIIRSLF